MDSRTVGNIVGVFGYGEDQLEAKVRTTLYTIGIAVGALALGSAAIAGQHALSAPNGGTGVNAGHVLHALDPTLEAKGPGSGYGVRRAAAGALQHIQLAARSEGASQNVQTHAGHVTASVSTVVASPDEATASAQRIRAATSASEAAPLLTQLIAQTHSMAHGIDANRDGSIGWQAGEGGLAQAKAHMDLMLKGEGL